MCSRLLRSAPTPRLKQRLSYESDAPCDYVTASGEIMVVYRMRGSLIVARNISPMLRPKPSHGPSIARRSGIFLRRAYTRLAEDARCPTPKIRRQFTKKCAVSIEVSHGQRIRHAHRTLLSAGATDGPLPQISCRVTLCCPTKGESIGTKNAAKREKLKARHCRFRENPSRTYSLDPR